MGNQDNIPIIQKIILSLATVDLAKAERINLVMLLAHCIDLMQQSDLICFILLKPNYKQLLTKFTHSNGRKQQLSKAALCTMISTIWRMRLFKKNIIWGFLITRNFSADSSKHKVFPLEKSRVLMLAKIGDHSSRKRQKSLP